MPYEYIMFQLSKAPSLDRWSLAQSRLTLGQLSEEEMHTHILPCPFIEECRRWVPSELNSCVSICCHFSATQEKSDKPLPCSFTGPKERLLHAFYYFPFWSKHYSFLLDGLYATPLCVKFSVKAQPVKDRVHPPSSNPVAYLAFQFWVHCW